MLNGCISIEGELHSNSGRVVISGKGTMSVPHDKYFGPLAGMGLTVNALADFGSRYVMAWENMTIFGNNFTVGIKCSFDGDVDLLGSSDLLGGDDFGKKGLRSLKSTASDGGNLRGATPPSASKKYIVSSSGMNLFQVHFSVTGAYMSLSYNGTEYSQEAISAGLYDNLQIVGKLTSANCITIAVNNADLGEWTVNVYGDENATFGAYNFAGTATEPVVNKIEIGEDARSATIRYTLGDLSGVENATVSIFRAFGSATDNHGALLAEFSAAEATGVFNYAPTDELPGGSYAFYVMVSGDNYAPVYSDLSAPVDFVTIDTEAPDQIQSVSAEWRSSGSTLTWSAPYDNIGVAGYKINYRASEEDEWTEVDVTTTTFTFDSVPNATYEYRVAAYDEAGNLAAWSETESVLVLTETNAAYNGLALGEEEILELAEYESANNVNVLAGATVTTVENSLISGGTLAGIAEIGGIVENASVSGEVTLLEGGSAFNTAVVSGNFTVSGTADVVTVAAGGTLTIEANGRADNVTVAAGGLLNLMPDAEFGIVSADYGAAISIIGGKDGRFLLSGDIRTAGRVNTIRYVSGNGHRIHFDQYRQTGELISDEVTGELSDIISLVPDIDKFYGSIFEVEIDTNVYAEYP